MTSPRDPWPDRAIAAALAVSYGTALVRSTSDLGYARDEGFYFSASSRYGAWFQKLWDNPSLALERRAVDAAWSVNHEHPGLIKSLFALSNLLLQQKAHLFAMEGTSFRFPAIVLASALVGLVYLWGAQARGRVAGLGAAVLFAAMPRVFFDAHLACFDVAIAALWTATAFLYDRTIRRGGWKWPLLTAVAFGLALDTKHNSWFLPFALGGHAMVLLAWARLGPAGRAVDAMRAFRRAFSALACMALVGPLLFYALWPWIWHDTIQRLREYATFHLKHDYYNMVFFGRTYFRPPMPLGYAWVMTLATVPTVTLVLAATGAVARVRALLAFSWRWTPALAGRPAVEASTDVLWAFAVGVNYMAWLSPNTPIFGGTKHWHTAYPFLALFAGVGLDLAVRAARFELARLRRRAPAVRALARRPLAVAAILAACAFAAPIAETWHSHPWGLSSYTPLVGGASGGATLGLNRGFWGYTTGAVAAALNRESRPGSAVYLHDTAYQSWDMLVRDGRIRRDIRPAPTVVQADLALYHHEEHMEGSEYQTWLAFGTLRPEIVGGLDGVPVIWVYKRP